MPRKELLPNNSNQLISLRCGRDRNDGLLLNDTSAITETAWIDTKGDIVFVSVTRLGEYVNIHVSDVSLFELHIHQMDVNVNFDLILDRIMSSSKELYELPVSEINSVSSQYKEEIQVACTANSHYYYNANLNADQWMRDYLEGNFEVH